MLALAYQSLISCLHNILTGAERTAHLKQFSPASVGWFEKYRRVGKQAQRCLIDNPGYEGQNARVGVIRETVAEGDEKGEEGGGRDAEFLGIAATCI